MDPGGPLGCDRGPVHRSGTFYSRKHLHFLNMDMHVIIHAKNSGQSDDFDFWVLRAIGVWDRGPGEGQHLNFSFATGWKKVTWNIPLSFRSFHPLLKMCR